MTRRTKHHGTGDHFKDTTGNAIVNDTGGTAAATTSMINATGGAGD